METERPSPPIGGHLDDRGCAIARPSVPPTADATEKRRRTAPPRKNSRPADAAGLFDTDEYPGMT